MKVSEVVNLCNKICNLGLPEDCDTVLNQEAANGNEIAQKLILCCNNVLEDLYCNYSTAIATCEVISTDGFVDTSSLALHKVLKLTDKYGNNVKFRYTATGLYVESGSYVLTYAKLPSVVDWNSQVVLPSPRLTERVLVYGILAEYFLLVEDVELAAAWETRYQNALRSASIKTFATNLPVRRWI